MQFVFRCRPTVPIHRFNYANTLILPDMKSRFFQQSIAFVLLIALFSGCASNTLIQSVPKGAKLYIDGSLVGSTPYTLRDTKITGATTAIKLEAPGYEVLNTYISKDEEVNVGAIVGGVFFLIPFLWIMKYKPVYTFEMKSKGLIQQDAVAPNESYAAERIRELKRMFDEGLITESEFEAAKKKVLEVAY